VLVVNPDMEGRPIASLLVAAVIAGCAHSHAVTTGNLRCPDAQPGDAMRITTEAAPSDESASLIVIVRTNESTALEPGSIRVFPRAAAGELRKPKPDSLGQYAYRTLAPGWYLVEVRKVGYDRIADSLELRRGTRHRVSFTMSPTYSYSSSAVPSARNGACR
jgi:hypothetical protein